MFIRTTLILLLACGLAAIEARADHHEGGPPGLQKKMGDAEAQAGDAQKKAGKEWKSKKGKADRELRKGWERDPDRSDSDSGSEASGSKSASAASGSKSASAASGSKSASAGDDASKDRARKEKSNAARERLTREERETLRAEEDPGFMGRMRRFFGFERSAERRSESGAEHEGASQQDRGPADR